MTRPSSARAGRGRLLVALFAIVLFSAAYVPAAWHQDHAADKDCTICKLGHQPITALPDLDPVGPAVSGTRAPLTDGGLSLVVFSADPSPPRAPPA